jgi:hypothetical protein
MVNFTETNYPFRSYVPSRFAAGALAIVVFISLVAWFIQSVYARFRPRLLTIFLLVSHLLTFLELVLRATLDINKLNTTTLYRVTAPMLSVPPCMLLLANYRCLVELRKNKPRKIVDIVIDITVPVGVLIAESLLSVASELSFKPNDFDVSFRLRQASAGFILGLAILFYVVWYFAVPHARRLYVLPLLGVSSICVLIEAVYILLLSIPSLFFVLSRSESWFYGLHLAPVALALITWCIFHPSRVLHRSKRDVPHIPIGKELFPATSSF